MSATRPGAGRAGAAGAGAAGAVGVGGPAGPVLLHPAVDVLRVLGVSRSTGAVELRGEPGGTIYLHEGDITYAEAPGTPRVLEPGVTDRVDYAAAVRAAVLETGLILLTAPYGATDRPLFRPGRRHWTGLACRLGVDDVLASVARAAAGLASLGGGPDGEVRTCALPRGGQVVLSAEAWEVVAGLDGVTTPRRLAWRSRLPLTTTVRVIASLVEAGVCAPVPTGPPATGPPPTATGPPPGPERPATGPPATEPLATEPLATAPTEAGTTAPSSTTPPPAPPPEVPAAASPVRSAALATSPAATTAPVPAAAALPRRAPGRTGVPASTLPAAGPLGGDDANRLMAQRLLDGLRQLP